MKLRGLLHLAAAYRRSLVVLMLLSILSSLVMLCVPWLAGRVLGGIVIERGSVANPMFLLLSALAKGRADD